MNHGLQHLCCCYYLFSFGNRLFNDLLLKHGNLFQRNFNTHISSGNHNTIGYIDDFVQILDTLHILNFSNDHHLGIVLIQNPAHLQHILFITYKRCRDNIKSQFNTEQDIIPVAFTDIRHGKLRARHIHALVIGNRSAVYNITDNIGIRNFFHRHLNQAVVDENRGSHTDIIYQLLIGNGSHFFRSHHFPGGQGEFLSGLQINLAAFKIPQTDFRSLGIQQRRNGKIQFLAHLAHSVIFSVLFFMISM